MLKIKVMSTKQASLGIERQYDLQGVLYIVNNNVITLSEINNNLLEVLGPMLRYHHA